MSIDIDALILSQSDYPSNMYKPGECYGQHTGVAVPAVRQQSADRCVSNDFCLASWHHMQKKENIAGVAI